MKSNGVFIRGYKFLEKFLIHTLKYSIRKERYFEYEFNMVFIGLNNNGYCCHIL